MMIQNWRRVLAAVLSAVILLLSPGPRALAAVAEAVAPARSVPAGFSGPKALAGLDFASRLSAFQGPRLGLLGPGLRLFPAARVPTVTRKAAAIAAPVLAVSAHEALAVSRFAALSSRGEQEGGVVDAALRTLQSGVLTLRKAGSEERPAVLSGLFSGGRLVAAGGFEPVVYAADQSAGIPVLRAGPEAGQEQEPPPAAALPPAAAEPPQFNAKAVAAHFVTGLLSVSTFILTCIAYPAVAIPAVGGPAYGALMALGPLAGIATGPLNGLVADRFSARKAMVFNMVVRGVLALALPAFAWLGVLNFWTLLAASIANGWILSSSIVTDNAYIPRLAGPHREPVTVLFSMRNVVLQVSLGLIIGIGAVIDKINPLGAFLISAVVHALVIPIILLFFMSDDPPQAKPGPAREPVRDLVKKYWGNMLLLGAAVGGYAWLMTAKGLCALAGFLGGAAASYAWLRSPLPIAAALLLWVWRTDQVRDLRAGLFREILPRENEISERLSELEKAGGDPAEIRALRAEAKRLKSRQFRAVMFNAVAAMAIFPWQGFALPLIALALAGAAGKGLLLGTLIGAMSFGNLISNSAQISPGLKLGGIPLRPVVQALVLGLGATWVFTSLVPGGVLAAAAAAAAAVAVAAGLMWIAGHVSHRGWIKFLGLGLAFVWLPYLAWTMPGLIPLLSARTALTLSMLVFGMFSGASGVSFINYTQSNTRKSEQGKVFGAGSSFFSTFTSTGYGLLALGAGMFQPAFPAMLLPICVAYLVMGLILWGAPKRMPGLPESVFKRDPPKP